MLMGSMPSSVRAEEAVMPGETYDVVPGEVSAVGAGAESTGHPSGIFGFSAPKKDEAESAEEMDGTLYYNDDIYLTGHIPGNGIIDVEPVEVEIDGVPADFAYDIRIYANEKQKEKGKIWQPAGKKVQVHLRDAALEDARYANVYHLADIGAEPELVAGEIDVEDGAVNFDAESFSIYAVVKLDTDILRNVVQDLPEEEIVVEVPEEQAETIGSAVLLDTFRSEEGTEMAQVEMTTSTTLAMDGVMPRKADVEVEPAEGYDDALLAYDITIRDTDETEYQPAEGESIEVSIRNEAISCVLEAGKVLEVYHVEEDGSRTLVESRAEGDTVTFDAARFSVYVIVDHENGTIITPRVEFHFISPDYTEDGSQYSAPGYEFRNKNNEYQISQILRNGESLEQIINPANKKDENGNEISFFYDWYTVDMVSDTTGWAGNTASPYYTGSITYTWPDPQKVDFLQPVTITDDGSPAAGEDITWSIGSTTDTAVLDEEGTAHVYLVPVYEDFYFVNLHMGSKESEPGLRSNLLTRRLVVFGQSENRVVRIGDVECPSPDPRHQIFSGWETITADNETDVYYQTMDNDGRERDVTAAIDGRETETESGSGYYVTVHKTGSAMSSLDLYPVFAEARWVYFNTGRSGNGAAYVGAQYRLTNDDAGKGTAFTSFPTTTRSGFTFAGWYLEQGADYNGTGTQLTDSTGAFVDAVKGKIFYGHFTTSTDPATGAETTTLTSVDNNEADGTKLFEITSDGKLYLYKALDSLTVYAGWNSLTVKYKLLFWKQNADDDDYGLALYKELETNAGDTIKLTFTGDNSQNISVDSSTGTAYDRTFTLQGTNKTADYYVEDISYLHLREHGYDGWTSSETEGGGTTWTETGVEIDGDGSTEINVYYDRNIYTLWFYLGESTPGTGTSTGYVQTPLEEFGSGETVYYKSGSDYHALTKYGSGDDAFYGYAASANAAENVYGLVDGVYVPLEADAVTTTTYTADYVYTQNNTATSGLYGLVNGEYVSIYRSGNRYYIQGSYDRYTDPRYTRTANGPEVASADVQEGSYYIDGNGGRVPVTPHSTTAIVYSYNGEPYSGDVIVKYTGPYYRQTTVNNANYYLSTSGTNYNYTSGTTDTVRVSTTTNPFEGVYTKTSSGSSNYTYYFYHITAKYGADISSQWPDIGRMEDLGLSPINNYKFVSWISATGSMYRANHSGDTNIKGVYSKMSEEIILKSDRTSTTDNTGSGNYPAHIFQSRYNTSPKLYTYAIYFWDPEIGGEGGYPASPSLSYLVNSNGTVSSQTQLQFAGYEFKLKDPTSGDGNTTTRTVIRYYYMPNQHAITFSWGLHSADAGSIITDINGTGEHNVYYNQVISHVVPAANYTAIAEAATPAGYYFKGWYDNQDGVGTAFNFDAAMPDSNMMVYAVYAPNRYRVIVDPNGAEIDHIDHTGASYTGTYNGYSYSIAPFNRGETSERAADAGYNRAQATYINGTYGEKISEYTLRRSYVPIGDTAAAAHEETGGRVYYYVNFQYNSTDGTGLPSDLRDALYIDVTPASPGGEADETELRRLYDFWHDYVQLNWDLSPGAFAGMTAQELSYSAWKSLYVDKQEGSSRPQLYRKTNNKETWVFLGWFKDGANTPYNFNDPVTGPFTLTARWRLDGGYMIQYTPEYWLESEDGNTYLINGNMESWVDPASAAGTLSYTDGASTEIYKQPTDLTKNGAPVSANSINFRGWRLVSVSTTGGSVVYTPLEFDENGDVVYYDPGDEFDIDVQYADSSNIIHMQAVYEESVHSVRRPEIANLILDANSGYLVDAEGSELTEDTNLEWNGPGTMVMDADDEQIILGDIQSSAAVHMYQYATKDVDTGLTGGTNYFVHPEGYFLLGFDPQNDPMSIVWVDPQDDSVTGAAQPYAANYAADSVIAVQRTDNKKIYAVWEPMVYMTFVNDTDKNDKAAGPVTFGLSPVNPDDAAALTVINVKEGMYRRTPLVDYSDITLQPGETITLAFPKGEGKSIKVSGTNDQLGNGSILYWQGELNGETSGHAAGSCDNGEDFSFAETLCVDKTGIIVTFTSDQHDRTLVFDDNYPGGSTQEVYFTEEEFTDQTASATMPHTTTRFGYTLAGWATAKERADAGTVDYAAEYVLRGSELTNFFGNAKKKTLYAVWKAEAAANTVYVFKTVPSPGSQTQAFTYTVSLAGTFTYDTMGSENLSQTGSFALKSGQHARIITTEEIGTDNSKAFLKAEISVYEAGVSVAGEASSTPVSTAVITAQASRNGKGSFRGTEIISVTESSAASYTPSIEIAASTDTENVKDLTASESDRAVRWTNPSAGGTVIYTNTLEKYDITVNKTTHVGSTTVNTQFAFTGSYTLNGDATDLGTFYVTSGSSHTLRDIPAGAELTISEIDTEENYITTVKVDDGTGDDETETERKTVTFTVSKAHVVDFTNTLKSYDVKLVKVDQDGTAGTVEAFFKLDASNHNIGTNMLASDAQGSDGVFYSPAASGYEPFYAGNTYTLQETYTETGYIGLSKAVTITVGGTAGGTNSGTDSGTDSGTADGTDSGDDSSPFTFSDDALTAEYDSGSNVWVIKVKNQATKDITIVKAFNDPLVTSSRTFKFSYSYAFGGKTESGTFTLSPVSGSTAEHVMTVPVGATDLVITELTTDSGDDHYAWVANSYDTTVQQGSEAAAAGTSYTIASVTDESAAGTGGNGSGSGGNGSGTDDTRITFTNTRKTNTVTVEKLVSDTSDTQEFDFTATLSYGSPIRNWTVYTDGTNTGSGEGTTGSGEGTTGSGEGTTGSGEGTTGSGEGTSGSLTTDGSGQVTFKLSHGGTQTLTVPQGAKLIVAETPTAGYTPGAASATYTDSDTADESFTVNAVTEDGKITFTNSTGADLTVTKTVTGEMGDQTKDFTIYVTSDALTADSYSDDTTPTAVPYTVQKPEGKTPYIELTLKHGDTVALKNLPNGTYTISEEPTGESYTTEITYKVGENGTETTAQTSAEIQLTDDTTVNITNNLDLVSPTGVRLRYAAYILMLLFGALLLTLAMRRRRA